MMLALLLHNLEMLRQSLCSVACFSSPTCWGYNFFVLIQIWVCEVSLEISLNVECNHGIFEPFDAPNNIEKLIFPLTPCEKIWITLFLELCCIFSY